MDEIGLKATTEPFMNNYDAWCFFGSTIDSHGLSERRPLPCTTTFADACTTDANEKLTVPFLHKSRERNANDSPIAHNIVAEHPSTRRLNRHE